MTISTLLANQSPLLQKESDNAFRVAIIGCGPKGLYCLQSLIDRFRQTNSERTMHITVFEPAKFPGAGTVYSPDQPTHLRMNFAAGKINAWEDSPNFNSQRPTLLRWLSENDCVEDVDGNSFVPRALVGRYLHNCYQQIIHDAPRNVTISHQPSSVESIVRIDDRWHVRTDRQSEFFDQVLITIGHGGWQLAGVDVTADRRDIKYLSNVFPVHRMLTEDIVPIGSRVAIRGFALTAIDAILSLTEGRGGKFKCDQQKVWRYEACGREPRGIRPYSRTGRPMLAKPEPQSVQIPEGLDEFWEEQRRSLLSEAEKSLTISYEALIRPFVFQSATEVLRVVHRCKNPSNRGMHEVEAWWDEWINFKKSTSAVYDQLNASYEIAVGRKEVDSGWALGECWRQLYPTLVELISHGGLDSSSWSKFRDDATEFERIAFGPPAENVGRMLSLSNAGLLDLTSLSQDNKFAMQDIDILVNAVLPSPHSFPANSFLTQLLHEGALHRCPCSGGIRIDSNGMALDENGNEISGLACIGRLTEGWVLGNDTLSRTLHDHPVNWAKSIIRKLHISS